MDVDHAALEAPEEGGREQLHVAGEYDELDAARRQPVGDRGVARLARRVLGAREDARLDAGAPRTLERRRLRLIGGDGDDVDPAAAVDAIEDGLQVGPGA